jgi:hypothetical protein
MDGMSKRKVITLNSYEQLMSDAAVKLVVCEDKAASLARENERQKAIVAELLEATGQEEFGSDCHAPHCPWMAAREALEQRP